MITFLLFVFVCSLLKIPVDTSNLQLFVMLAIMSDLNFLANTGK